MNEQQQVQYKYEGKISAAPKNVTEYQGQHKFGFKIEGDETWYNYHLLPEMEMQAFKNIMEADFKRGYKIKFNQIAGIVTDYVILERQESQGKSGFGNYAREDPKIKISVMLISYVKDLVVAGKVNYEDFDKEAKKLLAIQKELIK